MADYYILNSAKDTWFCEECLSSIFPYNYIVTDNEYYCALFNHLIPLSVNRAYLKSLAYNPFVTDNSHHIICHPDIDPDQNYFNSINNITSKYLVESEFNAFDTTSIFF